jgi:uncharacterized protein
MKYKIQYAVIAFALFATSCQGRLASAESDLLTDNSPGVLLPKSSVLQTESPFPTASSTVNPIEPPTSTVIPTPTPPHPLSMEWLRQQDYPASEIVIEEVLDPGANYHRMIASYQSEGLKIFALLTIPYAEVPEGGWPVIVFNHGYIAPEEYRTTERYIAYVDGFARNGYLVFRPDYRGHASSEGVARGAYSNPDYVVDVLNAVAALRAYNSVNPERIGLWGHSMGGYITLRAMLTYPEIRAGVIWAGVVASYPDLLEKWSRPSPASTLPPAWVAWRTLLVEDFGPPNENQEVWNSISANAYLADLSAPIQLHHGTADTSVPFEFTATLYDQLLQAERVAEFYTYDGDNHNLSNNFSTAMQRSIEFFDRYLK